MMSSHTSSPFPFDPNEFLDVANELAKTNDEAHLRAAIGRAYYALFLLARKKTGVVTKDNVHTAVQKAMRKRGDLKTAESKLRALSDMRKNADYDPLLDPTYKSWADCWSRAQLLIKDIHPKVK